MQQNRSKVQEGICFFTLAVQQLKIYKNCLLFMDFSQLTKSLDLLRNPGLKKSPNAENLEKTYTIWLQLQRLNVWIETKKLAQVLLAGF